MTTTSLPPVRTTVPDGGPAARPLSPRPAAPSTTTVGGAAGTSPRGTDPGAGAPPVTRRGGRGTVATRILGAVAVLGLAACATGVLAVGGLQRAAEGTEELVAQQAEVDEPLERVRRGQLTARLLVADLAAARTAVRKEEILAAQQANDAAVGQELAALGASSAADLPGWTEFTEAWEAWLATRDADLVPAATSGDFARYESMIEHRSDPAQEAYLAALDTVLAGATARVEAAAEAARSDARTSLVVVLVTVVGAGRSRWR